MTDSDIELDTEKKPKDNFPVWGVALVVVTFLCFATTLVVQFLEYDYMRGTTLLSGPYAEAELIPPSP